MSQKSYGSDIQQAIDKQIESWRQEMAVKKTEAPVPQPTRSRGGWPAPVETAPAPAQVPPPASASASPDMFAGGIPSAPAPAGAYNQVSALTSLDTRIQRLQQVRAWLGEDNELARFLDDVIGQQVKASEARQARRNAIISVLSLIAGWVLSLVGMPQLLSLLHTAGVSR